MMKPFSKKRRRPNRMKLPQPNYAMRRRVVLGVMVLALTAVVARAVERQVFEVEFLQSEGQRRYLRTLDMAANRGMIADRNGEPLAVSTPVDSVWANPQEIGLDATTLKPLAKLLGWSVETLRQKLTDRKDRQFVYLERHINPDVAARIAEAIKPKRKGDKPGREPIRGVYLQREYKRFYLAGEVAAHLVGFTDVDDVGREGLELAFNDWLAGEPGQKRVLKDGSGHFVQDIESIRTPKAGRDLVTSIDRRLQFLAYRELKAAVRKHRAKSGSAVIIDVRTGEVLALVSQPAYNPNGSRSEPVGWRRNRALTDVLEPGSTMKPVALAAAMEEGVVTIDSRIDTSPGMMHVGRATIKDSRDYGLLDVPSIIEKSSNVGISKIILDTDAEAFWTLMHRLGLGESTKSGFPGESAGQLPTHHEWSRFEQATMAFGYGLSVTPLQLAQVYAIIAADGVRRPLSLHKLAAPEKGERVLKADTARQLRAMMERVVSEEGTAPEAAIPMYRVAGKTGTSRKVAGREGYAEDRYVAVFAGMAPVSNPRLAMVVVVDEPSAGEFYGGKVAAPVFAKVMAGALRLLNIAPDRFDENHLRLAQTGAAR